MVTENLDMIEWSKLEFFVADHCNLKCTDCSTYSPFLNKSFSDFETFKRDVDKLSTFLKVSDFRFLGGEPLLHPDIIKYIQYVKEKNISKRVGICTNGSLLLGMSDEFFESLDYIHISKYEETNIKYKKIEDFLCAKVEEIWKLKKHKFYFQFQNNDENFIEYHTEKKLGELQAQENFSKCKLPNFYSCHTFLDGKYYKCSLSTFKAKYFNQIGKKVDFDFLESDSFDFMSGVVDKKKFKDYLHDDRALSACHYCHGSEGRSNKRKQMTTQEIKFYLNKNETEIY